MRFPDTITVFNQYSSEYIQSFYKTKISGVLFVKDEIAGRDKTGMYNSDAVSVFIPKIATVSKQYIIPVKYSALTEANLPNYFTLAKGDFIALGDLTASTDTIDTLKQTVGDIFEIDAISDLDMGGLKHFLVLCK